MRFVLDTSVMVAAMRSPAGASAALVVAAIDLRIEITANAGLFAEYEAVMTRSEHVRAARTTRIRIRGVLDDLAGVVRPARSDWSLRPQLSDADDEMVLEAAVNGGATAIVTFETRTFETAAARFGIEVLTPAAAFARIRE
jgi:putative PIN family toxin of toxin-antitoxin system